MVDKSDLSNGAKVGDGYLPGPKPCAPIPRYEPGTSPDRRHTPSLSDANSEGEGFSVAGIEGRIDRRKANIASHMVDTDPDQALRVIRHWLANTD
ncbi:hypothetical protein [Thalassospira australica]|uniref:hypothetical protein n=1 Tax=Thalassospira australica TaxID=1528106 RepID=UPI00384AB090